jgi:hypothetical protein
MQSHHPLDEPTNRLLRSPKFKRALGLLNEANHYAEQTGGNAWDFAIEIQHFRELGLSQNDLRFLVRLQLVVHASEMVGSGRNGRKFKATGELHFTNRTCFVLRPIGTAVTTSLVGESVDYPVSPSNKFHFPIAASPPSVLEAPIWDLERRSLLFRGRVVKQFKWHAANQEIILSTFQEEGWPARIDDPLAPVPTLDIKRRLSDAIKCLNRNQVNELIRFRGNGTGQAVVWEMVIPRYANSKVG